MPDPNSVLSERPAGPLDTDVPLKQDIRLLGRLLGDTLREQEGEDAFTLIERIRQTAIRFRRHGDTDARAELESMLNRLTPAATVSVVRAFSYFSQLANIAEDLHINRRRGIDNSSSSQRRRSSSASAR